MFVLYITVAVCCPCGVINDDDFNYLTVSCGCWERRIGPVRFLCVCVGRSIQGGRLRASLPRAAAGMATHCKQSLCNMKNKCVISRVCDNLYICVHYQPMYYCAVRLFCIVLGFVSAAQ